MFKRLFALIHIENKIDVSELSEQLRITRRDTAIETLSLIKREYMTSNTVGDWRTAPAVETIASVYGIDLRMIR